MTDTEWHVTTSMEEAILDYIGETVVVPKPLSNAIRVILGKSKLEEYLLFYYGKPSTEMLIKFGYVTETLQMSRQLAEWVEKRDKQYEENKKIHKRNGHKKRQQNINKAVMVEEAHRLLDNVESSLVFN